MLLESPEIEPQRPPEVEALDGGLIDDARRRHRHERIIVACLAALLAGVGAGFAAFGGGGAGEPAPLPPRSSPPTWLSGQPLVKPTHLRLVASENAGPASIVEIDSGRVEPVRGLGVPAQQRTWSPELNPLTAVPGGALAVVTRQDCARCTASQTRYLIGAGGSVRRIGSLMLARDQHASGPALGSSAASWVLTWPRSQHCTLRLEPRSLPAAAVPCGTVGSDTPAGLVISRGSRVMLVNPRTGRVREQLIVRGQFDVLNKNSALISTAPGFPDEPAANPTAVTLVNLSTGARLPLRWPSVLRFGYNVLPEPHGHLIAIEFVDPAYAGVQAADVWLIDPHTGAFRHVPGFPILEYLKFSNVAWSADHRLVVVAQGGGHTAVGLWRPGSAQLHVGRVPPIAGYSQFVALSR